MRGVATRCRPRHWIVMGSSFGIPFGARIVIFDDITVAQALHAGDFGLAVLSSCDVEHRRRNQRRLYAKATAGCVASSWAGAIGRGGLRDAGVEGTRCRFRTESHRRTGGAGLVCAVVPL